MQLLHFAPFGACTLASGRFGFSSSLVVVTVISDADVTVVIQEGNVIGVAATVQKWDAIAVTFSRTLDIHSAK